MSSLSGAGSISGKLAPEQAISATVSSAGSIDGSLSASKGNVGGRLTAERAISATLSAADSVGGSLSTGLSYDMLRNLPKLNGVTIQGSKVSRDYCIPTVVFDTTEHWSQCMEISEENTVYVYTDYSQDKDGRNISAIKIGDGTSYIVDLPFTITKLEEHIADTVAHVTAEEREFWNNKNRSYAYGETLILTNL